MKFPRVSATALAGEHLVLPGDFPGDPTLVLLTFAWEQRSIIDPWRRLADRLVSRYPAFDYCELSVVDRRGGVVPAPTPGDDPAWIGRVEDEEYDRRLVAFVDKPAFRRSLGLPDERTTYALLVEDGRVVRRAAGVLTDEAAAGLRSALVDHERETARTDRRENARTDERRAVGDRTDGRDGSDGLAAPLGRQAVADTTGRGRDPASDVEDGGDSGDGVNDGEVPVERGGRDDRLLPGVDE